MAVYEQVPASSAAHLIIQAESSADGHLIGSTTGSEANKTLSVEPGLEVTVTKQGDSRPYTAGYTGGSEIADSFFFLKGQTYTVTIEGFGQYKFSHWADNNSQDTSRAVTLSGDTTLTAVFDVVPTK
jgi:hypothetical protein